MLAKLLQVKARLLGSPSAAAVVVIAADYAEHPSETVPILNGFLAHVGTLRTSLERAAGGGEQVPASGQ